jgi:hypothetical protein
MGYRLLGTTGDVLTKKYHKGHKTTKAKGCFGNEKTKKKNDGIALQKVEDGKERIS